MQRRLFLVQFALLTHEGIASFSGSCIEKSPSSLRTSLVSNRVGARIDAGAELRQEDHPYDLSTGDRRFFRALVRRVLRGCNELEKHEAIIISVPRSVENVIGDDGALKFDVLFGRIASMTFPVQGTMQVLELEDACQAYNISELTKEDRGFLRGESAKCVERYGYPGLRGAEELS